MNTSALVALLLGTTSLVALLIAEKRDLARLKAISKTAASSCFLWLAIAWGALGSAYGQILFAGLVLCWLGDVLLIRPGQGLLFQAGIAAFLLGHLAYAWAFSTKPLSIPAMLGAAVVMLLFSWRVVQWLRPQLDDFMYKAVMAYCLAISAMLVVAAGAGTLPVIAAAAFAVSDLSVARDRFVAPGFANVAWGLPLYYLSQVAMAATLLC